MLSERFETGDQNRRHQGGDSLYSTRTRDNRTVLPPTYFLVSLLVMIAVSWVDPIGRVLPTAGAHLGAILIVAGIGSVLWAHQLFEDAGTTIKPFQRAAALVTGGPFRFTRNPMYLGMVIVLVGVALVLRSLLPWVVIPVFVWIIQRRFIVAEEQALERDFGEIYRDYRESVRRWI